MQKVEYKYYLLRNRWLARLEKDRFELEPKEFYKNGVWTNDDKLNLELNDAIMDYGDSSVFDYDEISEEEARKYITPTENIVEQMVNGIVGKKTENLTDREKEIRKNLSGRAWEYLMFMDDEE